MNENKKTVKRVLVLDEDGVRTLYSCAACEDFFDFFPALYDLMKGKMPQAEDDEIENIRDIHLAQVFWKAYGKEVSE